MLLAEHVAVVVLDGGELPSSICPTQQCLAHRLGSSLLLQGHVEDHLVLPLGLVLRLCFLFKTFSTIRYVEGLSVTNMANLKLLWLLWLYHHTSEMITSVKLVSRVAEPLIVIPSMLLIPCGWSWLWPY